MPTYQCFAPAKINLTLNITGRRDDGYHVMDSLVIFSDLCDRLLVTPDDQDSLEITGDYAAHLRDGPADDNIVVKALHAFRAETGWAQHVHIKLDKHIPVAAGIGGGSSNAAAMLKTLNTVCPDPVSDDHLSKIGLALGADVPVCLKAFDHHLWRMRGIGEVLDQVEYDQSAEMGLILVNPGISVPTASIFSTLRKITSEDGFGQASPHPHQLTPDTFGQWLMDGNSLTAPAQSLHDDITKALDYVHNMEEEDGFILAGMSGSGATVFALFNSAEKAKAALAARDIPLWSWCGGIFNANTNKISNM